jgi:hypothetical protein
LFNVLVRQINLHTFLFLHLSAYFSNAEVSNCQVEDKSGDVIGGEEKIARLAASTVGMPVLVVGRCRSLLIRFNRRRLNLVAGLF